MTEVAQPPSDAEIRKRVDSLVQEVDLETTAIKQFIKMLSQEFQCDLKPKKAFIKAAITDAISSAASAQKDNDNDDENSEEEESDEEASECEEETSRPSKKKRGGGGGGGLSAKKEISDKLAAFLNQGNEMARTAIVKSLWEYIREHDLQNPDNKREIFLDKAMRDVFGCKTFTMFTMNKYIGAHVHPFKQVDLSSNSSSNKTPKKRKAAGGASSSSSTAKKQRKPGTQPPYYLSPELEAICGESQLPRPQVVKAIWDYIKINELQNPNDRREILCDEKLQAVMKKKKVTMFNMNQCITPHLLERVEKSKQMKSKCD